MTTVELLLHIALKIQFIESSMIMILRRENVAYAKETNL
jgi:hypothetical protein